MGDEAPSGVWTVGHSTRALEDFVALLHGHRIGRLVDVRTLPRSRRHPHFDGVYLITALPAAGIVYTHLPGLGGLRAPRPDSPNGAWRNRSFRAYADYMQTPAFTAALADLTRLAAAERVAMMCAEALPWRCHRSLVADALTARGIAVLHIVTSNRADAHALTPSARVDGSRVTYPPAQAALALAPPATPLTP